MSEVPEEGHVEPDLLIETYLVNGWTFGSAPSAQSEPLRKSFAEIDLGPVYLGTNEHIMVNDKGQVLIPGENQSTLWEWGQTCNVPFEGVDINNEGRVLGPLNFDQTHWQSWKDGQVFEHPLPWVSTQHGFFGITTLFLDNDSRACLWLDWTHPHGNRLIGGLKVYHGNRLVSERFFSQTHYPSTITESGDMMWIHGINSSGDYFGNRVTYPDGLSTSIRSLHLSTETLAYLPIAMAADGTTLGMSGSSLVIHDTEVWTSPKPYPGLAESRWRIRSASFDGDRFLAGPGIGLQRVEDENGYRPDAYQEVLMPDGFIPTDMSDNGLIAGYREVNGQKQGVLLLKVDMVPDWNRDGEINELDRGQATESNPFRFWVNDDNDRVGQEVSNDDVPGQTDGNADAVTGFSGTVDGMRDLVDFFPLFFDLEDFLESFDDLSMVDLKLSGQGMRFLKYEDGYAGFDPAEAGKFLNDVLTARALADDDTRGISTDPNNPTDLGAEFVTLASQGKGVLLMESYAATTDPLKLHVFVNDNELFTYDFHLKTTTVEEMFEHRDLTGLAKEYDGTAANLPQSPAATRTSAPNWPNEMTNGKTFAFVHGYNVSGQAARGWHAEVFKRMHQMGSNARFVGITWNGDTGLDYHKAVFQAFHTGDAFNPSLGGDVTIAAHSLGNVVVGQAIQSSSFIPTRYYMINAATPNEAYGSGGSATDMVEKDWTSIQDTSLYASNWYQQFDASDGRFGFAWQEAFILVPDRTEVHNFFSPGEDVLDVLDGDNDASVLGQLLTGNFNFVRGAWKSQELVKGKTGFGSLASLALSRGQAGWRLNSSYQAGDDIKEIPRFSPFRETNLHSSDAQVASGTATQNVRFDLLARGIPALSDAAAVDTVPGVINFDMEDFGRSGRGANEWPTEDHGGESNGDWLHSDFRNVALPFVYPMYLHMINQGGLNDD